MNTKAIAPNTSIVSISASLKSKSGTLIARAHEELKSNIIMGLHRPGEKLRVEHLKREYGVSSGTLREALTMLIADKLVIAEGQRGFRVAKVSMKDLEDLSRIRVLLEKEAITQAIRHGDDEWEAKVVSSYHLLKRATTTFSASVRDESALADWEKKHREFHIALISAAPSDWIRYFLELSYQQYQRYRHMFLEVAEEFYKDRDADAEHAELVEAVCARDAELASRLIEEHLTRSIQEWVSYFEKIGSFDTDESSTNTKKLKDK